MNTGSPPHVIIYECRWVEATATQAPQTWGRKPRRRSISPTMDHSAYFRYDMHADEIRQDVSQHQQPRQGSVDAFFCDQYLLELLSSCWECLRPVSLNTRSGLSAKNETNDDLRAHEAFPRSC